MEISMKPELKQYIEKKIRSGLYNSTEEVVHEALYRMQEDDKVIDFKKEKLVEMVMVAIKQIERGEYAEYNEKTLHELFEDIKARGKAKLKAEERRSK